MIGSVEVRRSGGLRIVRDDDKFGSSEVTSLQVVCDDDKFGSSEVYSLRGTMMSLEVRKFTCCV